MFALPKQSLNIKLLALELFVLILSPVWILKLIHYFSFPMPFMFGSTSLVPHSQNYTLKKFSQVNLLDTLMNILAFGVFFVQHIFMARLSFKIHCQKNWLMFPAYERLIYNIISSILIMIILEFQNPQNYILFTLPLWICLPLSLIGIFFFLDSNLQMQGSLLFPYKFSQLLNSRQIDIRMSDYTKVEETGITIKGSYSIIRHPMQSGCILLLAFGNCIFTFEKICILTFMISFIFIGVAMEQKRLLAKYKQYEYYIKNVQCRFIPYVI